MGDNTANNKRRSIIQTSKEMKKAYYFGRKDEKSMFWNIAWAYTLQQSYATVSFDNLKPPSFTAGVALWAGGLRQVKPVVQSPLLFSAWLDCNFLGFREQDTLPCTLGNRPDVHLVPVCGLKIKDTHIHSANTTTIYSPSKQTSSSHNSSYL